MRRFEFVLRLVLGKKCAARAACIPRVKHSVNGAKAYRSRVLRDPIAAGDRMAFARDDAGCEAGSLFFFRGTVRKTPELSAPLQWETYTARDAQLDARCCRSALLCGGCIWLMWVKNHRMAGLDDFLPREEVWRTELAVFRDKPAIRCYRARRATIDCRA